MKHWTFARGGAWRNPNPDGGPYICEQCRLDARSGNDGTLTLQTVTEIELAPADAHLDGGGRRSRTGADPGVRFRSIVPQPPHLAALRSGA